ncbi:PREDICTED: kinectin [Nanorana parkeri]|uniref:kinectin n=1 Tax=Nanorana parkeri TaxID=125878 RepID=UPI0008541F7A|nr:PREDICTED: kinectin [Nanorana parkeri]
MEFYESTYFIVLFPIVVITALLLFFWLFMKETSYDEILAKQKKDQKLPPAKVDKKKTDKKKNKKKEPQNENLHESDSEMALNEFDLGDALSSEEEHVVPAPIIPAEAIGSVRERKKKEKKLPKPVVKEPVVKEPVNKEVNGTKVPVKKPEPVPVTKQPTPPPEITGSKKKAGPRKQKNGQDDSPISPGPKNEQVVPSKRQESLIPMAEVKPQEPGSGKKTAPKKKQKKENFSALVEEPLIEPSVYIPLMDNSEPPLVEKREVRNFEKAGIPEVTQKSGGKKGKNVTDKENAEVKFKDFVATLRSMIFSDDEAMSVVEMMKDKSISVKDLVHKANKGNSAAALQIQEREKQLAAARDEAAIVKEQCKQLTQELVTEKQKLSLVDAKARERIGVLEKENGVFQSKLHSGFQDAQQLQVKFQQVREQLENQLAHLKQENGILRDAVSSATNQMESKQSNELIKLRQDYARLVKELNDKNSSLAQEELQKKNQEQAVAGLKAQIQDAERRWEEVESYLRKRASEAEKAQQDFQSKLIGKEAEVQSLHSKLTDTMVSNQQLEQKIMQFMDAGQDDSLQIQLQDMLKQNDTLSVQIQKYHSQMQAQSSASVIVEELQKTIEEKDKDIKHMEDSLSLERANFANSGEELKDLRKQNESLSIQIQKYISQMQTQASATLLVEELQKTIAEKDKEIKQVKDAVALEQANFANSGEELKTLQRENISLKAELQKIHALKSEQEVSSQALGHLERSTAEKDEKIRALEGRLEAQLEKVTTNLQEHKALQSLNNELKVQVQKLQEQLLDQTNKDLLGQMEKSIEEKDEKIKTVEELLETGLIQVANREEELRRLRDENGSLRMDVQNLKAQHNDQVALSSVVEDLKNVIHEKDGKIRSVEDLLQAEQLRADNEGKTVQALTKEIEALKEALGNSQLEKTEQVSSIAQIQDLQNQLKGKEETLKKAEERFNERERLILEKERQIEDLHKESSQLKIHIEEVQHRLQQQDSGSTEAQDLQRILLQRREAERTNVSASRLRGQEQKIRDVEAIILEREKSIAGTTQELTGLKKENEILKIQASELQKIHDQQLQQVSSFAQSEELLKALAEKDRYITQLLEEVESQKAAVEQQRKKNNDLREKNWKAMEALASTEKMLQERVNKTAKEQQQNLHTGETEAREVLQKIFPNVSVSASLHHGEWIQEYERLAKVCLNENGGSEKVKALEQKLKEGEEMHTLLQLESDKYKSVLAETEGILQRLQRSVEEEEGRWKLKLEESQNELTEAASAVRTLEQELDKLRRRSKEAESLLKEKENLETGLEKAEVERTTYVSEVRELKDLLTELQRKLGDSCSEAARQNEELTLLKTQLNDTLKKLEVEQSERQKVASDVHEVQKSLDLLQVEILKGSGDCNVIDYSDFQTSAEQTEEDQERIEKMPRNLSQTVTQLQQRLQAVNQQLTKGRENVQIIG